MKVAAEDAKWIGEGKEFHKGTTDTKRRIYEILNESAVQTREDYDNVVMTGKGVEKSTWWNTRLTINDLVAHG